MQAYKKLRTLNAELADLQQLNQQNKQQLSNEDIWQSYLIEQSSAVFGTAAIVLLMVKITAGPGFESQRVRHLLLPFFRSHMLNNIAAAEIS